MKKIFYLFVILSLTACVASKWHDENDTRSVLGKIVDSKYDPKYDNLVVENLNTYWTIKAHYNSDITISSVAEHYLWMSLKSLPSNRISQGCNVMPDGRDFSFLFRDTPWNKEISFNNQNAFLIQQGKKVKLKPAYKYYNTWKEGTFTVSGKDKQRKYDSSFAFHIPCNEIITPDTIVHIGGIYEDGKELPPIEFKIFKKTDGQ